MQFVQKLVLLWQEHFKAQNAPNCRNYPSTQLAYTKLQSFKDSNSVWYNMVLYSFTMIQVCHFAGIPVTMVFVWMRKLPSIQLPWCPGCNLAYEFIEKLTGVRSSCFNISVAWHFTRRNLPATTIFSSLPFRERSLVGKKLLFAILSWATVTRRPSCRTMRTRMTAACAPVCWNKHVRASAMELEEEWGDGLAHLMNIHQVLGDFARWILTSQRLMWLCHKSLPCGMCG